MYPNSFINFVIHMASLVAWVLAMYWRSDNELSLVAPRNNSTSDHEYKPYGGFPILKVMAQSTSQYPIIFWGGIRLNCNLDCKVSNFAMVQGFCCNLLQMRFFWKSYGAMFHLFGGNPPIMRPLIMLSLGPFSSFILLCFIETLILCWTKFFFQKIIWCRFTFHVLHWSLLQKSTTPSTFFMLSRNTTFGSFLMILLVSTHIKQYVLVPSQYLKDTRYRFEL